MDYIRQGQSFFICRANPPWLPGIGHGYKGRAATGGRPYTVWIQDDDAVNVIGHQNKRIDIDPCIMARQVMPRLCYHFSWSAGVHSTFNDIAEQTKPFPHAHCYKIGTSPTVIIILQSQGSALVCLWIKFHFLKPVTATARRAPTS